MSKILSSQNFVFRQKYFSVKITVNTLNTVYSIHIPKTVSTFGVIFNSSICNSKRVTVKWIFLLLTVIFLDFLIF